MKELSNNQIQQVSGGFSLGSFMSLIGLKDTGSKVHEFELKVYDDTLGKLSFLDMKTKQFFTDFFGQFKGM